MSLYLTLAVVLGALLAAGVLERHRHNRRLLSIPTRVLVNGIRGKSSVTRLCAGALRGGSLRVVAKTTGTAARFIHADGTEEPVHRKFELANIAEQIDIVRRAAADRPDALVIECMAVMPALQEVNQSSLIRSDIGVLTNVREDHLAEMGPTLADIARSLSRSMPVGGVCVTAERDLLEVLRDQADRRSCRLVTVDPATVTDEEMSGFAYHTFKENVAVAVAVAELCGIPRDLAVKGMWAAPPDPGVLTVHTYSFPGKTLRVANVFAANDPRSTVMNFQQLRDSGLLPSPIVTLINCRPDRIERNAQMADIVPDLLTDELVLIGHPTRSARDRLPAGWQGPVTDLGGVHRPPKEILRSVLDRVDREATLVAVGSIHGRGEALLEYLDQGGTPW